VYFAYDWPQLPLIETSWILHITLMHSRSNVRASRSEGKDGGLRDAHRLSPRRKLQQLNELPTVHLWSALTDYPKLARDAC